MATIISCSSSSASAFSSFSPSFFLSTPPPYLPPLLLLLPKNTTKASSFKSTSSSSSSSSSFISTPKRPRVLARRASLHKTQSLSEGIHIANVAVVDPGLAALVGKILGPLLAAFNFLFILRIVMSWYPQLPVNKLPFVIAYVPTEPVLAPTRKLIPPVGGVDVSPVIWLAVVSFCNEILLGQQGLLVLLSQQQQPL